MKNDDPRPDSWLKRRARDVAWAGVLAGPGYLYRPREVLFLQSDEQRVVPLLRDVGGEPDERTRSRVYLGVHYQWDGDHGFLSGSALGDYVVATRLLPLGG